MFCTAPETAASKSNRGRPLDRLSYKGREWDANGSQANQTYIDLRLGNLIPRFFHLPALSGWGREIREPGNGVGSSVGYHSQVGASWQTTRAKLQVRSNGRKATLVHSFCLRTLQRRQFLGSSRTHLSQQKFPSEAPGCRLNQESPRAAIQSAQNLLLLFLRQKHKSTNA